MSSYFLCAAGVTLRNQINRKFPRRDKKSDGWIGDAAHAATVSDHNPDWSAGGVVRAIDIDSDLNPKANNHKLATELAESLRQIGRAGNDHRLSYVIWNKRICSPRENWAWRSYTGTDPHTNHIHVSFTPAGDAHGRKFPIQMLKTFAG